ncbi:MAG TPA: response regulator [Steroidobacteraceae bacterium]
MTYKVLIVDDSKLARMSVIKALNALHPDWTRIEAADADEALLQINQQHPDIVLLDFNMPGKDGLAFAAELRQQHSHMSVALVSANRQVEVIRRSEAAGAAFLAKPLTEEALREFLDNAVQKLRGAVS